MFLDSVREEVRTDDGPHVRRPTVIREDSEVKSREASTSSIIESTHASPTTNKLTPGRDSLDAPSISSRNGGKGSLTKRFSSSAASSHGLGLGMTLTIRPEAEEVLGTLENRPSTSASTAEPDDAGVEPKTARKIHDVGCNLSGRFPDYPKSDMSPWNEEQHQVHKKAATVTSENVLPRPTSAQDMSAEYREDCVAETHPMLTGIISRDFAQPINKYLERPQVGCESSSFYSQASPKKLPSRRAPSSPSVTTGRSMNETSKDGKPSVGYGSTVDTHPLEEQLLPTVFNQHGAESALDARRMTPEPQNDSVTSGNIHTARKACVQSSVQSTDSFRPEVPPKDSPPTPMQSRRGSETSVPKQTLFPPRISSRQTVSHHSSIVHEKPDIEVQDMPHVTIPNPEARSGAKSPPRTASVATQRTNDRGSQKAATVTSRKSRRESVVENIEKAKRSSSRSRIAQGFRGLLGREPKVPKIPKKFESGKQFDSTNNVAGSSLSSAFDTPTPSFMKSTRSSVVRNNSASATPQAQTATTFPAHNQIPPLQASGSSFGKPDVSAPITLVISRVNAMAMDMLDRASKEKDAAEHARITVFAQIAIDTAKLTRTSEIECEKAEQAAREAKMHSQMVQAGLRQLELMLASQPGAGSFVLRDLTANSY
ncbi:hypothetical protein LTS18_006794 [Coniosporium uncinatum]|uniref:Uncharacterized protein n=1 Tax=Coniosporium uncinatum TaxID=93489 RepID=A0ACC3D395_9PEZI|nr:hypothetical protein LTS18_006794 [Coniosporium uncinatum]